MFRQSNKAHLHRIGVAAARRERLPGEERQLARCWHDGPLTIAMVAGGSECAWSAYFARGSGLLLDIAVRAWRASSGSPEARLRVTTQRVEQEFPEAVCALVAPDDGGDYDMGPPGGSAVMAVASASEVWTAWLGGESASLVRASRVIAATTPHTIKAEYRALQQYTEEQLETVPEVATRYLAIHSPNREFDHLPVRWTAQSGDRLVLLSSDATRRIASEDLATRCARFPDPQPLADHLVSTAMGRDAISAAAVVVSWPHPHEPDSRALSAPERER